MKKMAVLDTIMNDLELCTHPAPSQCRKCTHKGTPDDCPFCFMRLAEDTLELLKEIQPKEPMQLKYSETREEYWFYESICPKCGNRWISNRTDHFCPDCGQPVFEPCEEEQKE